MMKITKLDNRFFESTRGRIVTLLRSSSRTVDELAKELDLTDNAVRAHLLTLERDGLVQQSGIIKGFRKPHFAYSLTHEAERLFPKSYDSLLNQLLSVLKNHLSPKSLKNILYEVGKKVAGKQSFEQQKHRSLDARLDTTMKALEDLGGSATLSREKDKIVIISRSCPLAAAVVDHPEICKVAESLIQEIVGAPVTEICIHEDVPQCRFEIMITE